MVYNIFCLSTYGLLHFSFKANTCKFSCRQYSHQLKTTLLDCLGKYCWPIPSNAGCSHVRTCVATFGSIVWKIQNMNILEYTIPPPPPSPSLSSLQTIWGFSLIESFFKLSKAKKTEFVNVFIFGMYVMMMSALSHAGGHTWSSSRFLMITMTMMMNNDHVNGWYSLIIWFWW